MSEEVRVFYGANGSRKQEKYKMCKAVLLTEATKSVTAPIIDSKNYPENKRKEFIIAAFIVLLRRAEHLSSGVVEADETLKEVLARCGYEASLGDWMNLINGAFVEKRISSLMGCNCIFQLNTKVYHFPIHRLPKKELASIGDYNF